MAYRVLKRNENIHLPSIYNIDPFCRVFIDERKTQQNRQERRREKVKKTHESQMSELKRYVQNVRTLLLFSNDRFITRQLKAVTITYSILYF